jgi:hypothetical protein
MDPHPEQEDQPEARTRRRGELIAAVVIGAIFLIVIVLHLTGVMGPGAHG